MTNFVKAVVANGATVDGVPLTGCTDYTDDVAEASVDDDGEWIAEDLMEGIWEVVVDLPAGYVHVNESGAQANDDNTLTVNVDENTYFTRQAAELTGGRADDGMEVFHIKDRNAGDGAAFNSLTIDGTTCVVTDEDVCGNNEHDDNTISVVLTASPGATVRLSSSATEPSPTPGRTTYSAAVTNRKATTVSLPMAGEREFHIHVAAEDGYSTNMFEPRGVDGEAGMARTVENFVVRRDADIRLDELTIQWRGDRIELDRTELGLSPGSPDGETGPVTGPTTVSVTLDKGDGGAAVPDDEALTLIPVGINTGFDLVAFSAILVDDPASSGQFGNCTDTSSAGAGTVEVEANETTAGTTGKGEAAICFSITDSNGQTDDLDARDPASSHVYRVILTRK